MRAGLTFYKYMNILIANMGHLRIFYRGWINYVYMPSAARHVWARLCAAARECGKKSPKNVECVCAWKRTSFLAAFCFVSSFLWCLRLAIMLNFALLYILPNTGTLSLLLKAHSKGNKQIWCMRADSKCRICYLGVALAMWKHALNICLGG